MAIPVVEFSWEEYKKCAPKFVFFNEKIIQKDSDDFWRRKLTLKVRFQHFLTPPHYTNLQNSMISFDYSWFLAKNLSNFVSLPWKLHNSYCHIAQALQNKPGGMLIGGNQFGGQAPMGGPSFNNSVVIWHSRLWSFQRRDTKLERFLAKNQLYSNEITKFWKLE